MSKSLKFVLSIVVLGVVGCSSSFVLLARRDDATPTNSRPPIIPELVPHSLSGTYQGMIYLRKNRNEGYTATLYINEDKTFQLVSNEQPLVSGKIETWIIPEKDNLGAGNVTLTNQKQIEIRWHRNEYRDTLKILRAQGAKRNFRFCSANLTGDECFGTVAQ